MNDLAKRSISSPDLTKAANTLHKSVWRQLDGLKRSLSGQLLTQKPRKSVHRQSKPVKKSK
jgi:hypothetical protein